VNLWAMHAEIFKRYLYGERVLFGDAVIILVGRNTDWIEHFNCGGNEFANELVVRLQLMSYKLFQMLTLEISRNDIPRRLDILVTLKRSSSVILAIIFIYMFSRIRGYISLLTGNQRFPVPLLYDEGV